MNNQDIGFLLKQLNDKMKQHAEADLKEIDMTISQTRVMRILHEKGGQATQKAIEDYLRVAHPTVVGIVSRLEKSGFVTCHADENDRRNKVVCVTEKARKCEQKMFASRAEHEKKLLKSFDDEEVSQLRRMLQRMYNNIE